MDPPPSTPIPRRFLLPKRSTQSSSQTPGAPPRFQPTPRFGSSSASRPSQRRELHIDDFEEESEDEVIRSDSSSVGKDEVAHAGMKHVLRDDTIDSDSSSDAGTASPDRDAELAVAEPIEADETGLGEVLVETPVKRESKRRRLSISPAPASSSPVAIDDENVTASQEDNGMEMLEEAEHDVSGTSQTTSQVSLHDEADRGAQQPVFQQAPRFKPVEQEDAFAGLPEAFSPKRRGAKYLPGGMAAELQGWLADVKGWEGSYGGGESSTLKVTVDEVKPGSRMCLIKGHASSDEEPKRWILAGQGQLTGLGRRAEVKLGSVVIIAQPVWDIELEGLTWNVACDWRVESSEP